MIETMTTTPNNSKIIIKKQQKLSPEQEIALYKEIESKSKFCSNPSYECSVQTLDGFEYCMKHILLDPNAPFKQCSFIYSSNGKRCQEASPVYGGKAFSYSNYCYEHTRSSQLKETKSVIGKYKPYESTETLVHDLCHYVKVDKYKSPIGQKTIVHDDDEEEIDVVTPAANPFHEVNVDSVNNKSRDVLNYASDSSSEEEITTLGNTWRGTEMDNSDDESIDSQAEDYLKHAGIYTAEEATMITKERLIQLRNLYMDQFRRLHHILKEKRKQYLLNVKKEKETYSNIYDQERDSPKERKLYEKLRAFNHYHKRYGIESVLRKRYMEKRTNTTEVQSKNIPKCHYIEGGVKCLEKSLPCSKFCRKHVLEDRKQVLFKACGVEKSGVVCQEPLVNIFEDSTCVLHMPHPAKRAYSKRKYESETEDEDTEIKEEPKEIKEETVEMDTSSIPLHQENNITIIHEPMEIVKNEEIKIEDSSTSVKAEIQIEVV